MNYKIIIDILLFLLFVSACGFMIYKSTIFYSLGFEKGFSNGFISGYNNRLISCNQDSITSIKADKNIGEVLIGSS